MAWPDTTVGQFVQLQYQGTLHNGQAWRNSYHLWGHDAASPVEVADLTALLASAAITDLTAKYAAIMNPQSTIDGVLARQVFDPLNPSDVKNEAFLPLVVTGGVTSGNDAPTETCPVMKLGSDAAGRSAHGRVFLPWYYNIGTISGELFATGLVTLLNNLRDSLLKFAYTSGSHWTGAAVDFDLALFSATRRARNESQYGYRVVAGSNARRVHWLRSRGPRS